MSRLNLDRFSDLVTDEKVLEEKREYCNRCGTGPQRGDPPCPKCGRSFTELNLTAMSENQVEDFVNQMGRLRLSEEYIANPWNKDIFWRNTPKQGDLLLRKYVDGLEKIHEEFRAGNLANKSTLVIAPLGYSKTTWAGSCMSFAYKNQYKVAPLLSTQELNRLVTISCYKDFSYKIDGWSYEDYMMADVAFITVSKNQARYNAASIIMEVVSMRGTRGLETHILSEFSERDLSYWEKDRNFHYLVSKSRPNNSKKFLDLIKYEEV
jgi:ribosomal protein S27AE